MFNYQLVQNIIFMSLKLVAFIFLIQYRAKDEEAGEIPVAFVVRKSGTALSSAQVMEYVAKQVTRH
jgi:hypothetical protein